MKFLKEIQNVKNIMKIVFSKRKYAGIGAVSFILFFTFYIFTLPATYTGGRVGFVSLQFLTWKLAAFSFVMAVLISLIISFILFMVFSFRQSGRINKSVITGGFLGSILPPLLCCSPLIPSFIGIFGAVAPGVFSFGGAIQGFIAVNEDYILSGAILLLLFSVVKTAKSVNAFISNQCYLD